MVQRRGEEFEEAEEEAGFCLFFLVGPIQGAHNLPGVALFRFLQVEEVTVLEVLLLALLLLTFDP